MIFYRGVYLNPNLLRFLKNKTWQSKPLSLGKLTDGATFVVFKSNIIYFKI